MRQYRSGRLTKRGRVWYGHVYEDGVRLQRSTGCHDRKAAEEVAAQWERDAVDPAGRAARTATLNDALDLLLRTKRELVPAGKRSRATVGYYEGKAGHLVRMLGHGFLLSKLTANVVDTYVSGRRGERPDPEKAELPSENTIAKELGTLRAALRLAKRAGMWSGDTAAILPLRFSAEYEPRTRFLSGAEMQRLLPELVADRAARAAFVVATSARLGETDRARPEDIPADFSVVALRGTKTALSRRTVPVVSEEQRTLLRYAVAHAEGTGGLLFRPWLTCNRDLRTACKRAGIPRCSMNDLRRTFATWLHAAGAPLELLSPCMGHKDTKMLERVYARLPIDALGARIAAAIGVVRGQAPEMPAEGDPSEADPTASLLHQSETNQPDSADSADSAESQKGSDSAKSGGPCENRTRDRRIKSPRLLWPAPRDVSRKPERESRLHHSLHHPATKRAPAAVVAPGQTGIVAAIPCTQPRARRPGAPTPEPERASAPRRR